MVHPSIAVVGNQSQMTTVKTSEREHNPMPDEQYELVEVRSAPMSKTYSYNTSVAAE